MIYAGLVFLVCIAWFVFTVATEVGTWGHPAINKQCPNCGATWHHLPDAAREWIDAGEYRGHFFECHCGSTLLTKAF